MSKKIIDTIERCLYTFAESMLGFITVGMTLSEIPWSMALSVSAVATLACFLKQTAKYLGGSDEL